MVRSFVLSIAAAFVVSAAGRGQVAPPFVTPFPDLRGEYLGQTPPGMTAQRFAPGIVSTDALDSPPVFTPDGREVFWSRIGPSPGVFHSPVDGGRWTAPEKTPFCRNGGLDVTPLLFDGGRQIVFLSTRALPDGRQPTRGFYTFWLTRREGAGWSTPTAIDSFFTGVDDFGAIAEDGTLYLRQASATTGIQRVARRDGRYLAPEPLSPALAGGARSGRPRSRGVRVHGAMAAGGHGDGAVRRRRPGRLGARHRHRRACRPRTSSPRRASERRGRRRDDRREHRAGAALRAHRGAARPARRCRRRVATLARRPRRRRDSQNSGRGLAAVAPIAVAVLVGLAASAMPLEAAPRGLLTAGLATLAYAATVWWAGPGWLRGAGSEELSRLY